MKLPLAIAGILIASSVNAFAGQSVTLHFKQARGYFYCKVTDKDPSSTVNIDTNHVNVNGFCEGRPYVIKAGHISHMPISTVNKVAFGYKDGITGSVTITANSPTAALLCNQGDGDRQDKYGDDCYGLKNHYDTNAGLPLPDNASSHTVCWAE